jgi:superfamily I DNA and/or RNA helicase
VLAAMKAEAEFQERDTRPARNTMVSAQALRAAADGAGECPVPGVADLLSLHSLSPQQRHDLCAFWIRSATVAATKEYESIETQLGAATVLLEHARERARQEVLRDIDVIGLTTTGCAMHQDLLRSLKPSVLVVEEAAEILEAQLLACFTESLTQIVLIGDHYQLQPKVETMALERHNHMNVSLFERLVRPIEPVVLVEQRRMRPSIADLVRPFYDKDPLRDHESVALRPYIDKHGHEHTHAVPGLQRDVFLWTHTRPEEPSKVGRSMVNMLEAEMVTATVRHLIRQGVRPPSITVITPYLGQRRLLKTVLREHASKDVRISTVDRFQGDEADVIVLSLVRTKKLTQFIRMRNRMIVACSRARFAMVVIGSVELLQQSEHWSVVLKHLNEAGCVGDKLPIVDETTKDHNEVSANVPLREWLPAYAAEKK